MDIFLRVDINLVSMLMLGFVLTIAYHRLDRRIVVNKVFLLTSFVVILQLAIETISCFINKQPGDTMIFLSNLFHVLLFVIAPMLSYVWYILIKNIVVPYGRFKAPINMLLLIPVAANVILAILSPFFGLLFEIDNENVYSRGELFFVSAIITYLFLALGALLIVSNKNKIVKNEFSLFLFVSLLPIVGGIFQSIFYGALLMWSMAAFSLVIGYLFLQQRMVFLDNLTGCWNRDSFLYFLSLKLKRYIGKSFGAIYLDVNGLKMINDNYGHLEGDRALKIVSRIIKQELGLSDIVARMGGDEFVVITDSDSREYLEGLLQRIKSGIIKHNDSKTTPYAVDCSYGFDLYTDTFASAKEFLNHVDTLMYEDKMSKTRGE